MSKFLTSMTILVFTLFFQGCNQDLQIQGNSHIYINERQSYKIISITNPTGQADTYQWSVKSKKKDYTLTNDETSEVFFHAKSVGTYTLEVKVKKGNKTFKTELEIEVTEPEVINGYTLPSEPDPTINDSTLLGIDVNNNGVRDDVERLIIIEETKNTNFPKTHIALSLQYAWAWQKILTNPTLENRYILENYSSCKRYFKKKHTNDMPFVDIMKWKKENKTILGIKLDDKIFNTKLRIEQNFQFNQACSGHIFNLPGVLEILCQSDRIYSKGLNNESNT